MSFMKLPFRKSMVMVELEASTRLDRVDIDAESTRITTMAMRMSGRPESIVGITASYPPTGMPLAATSMRSENSRPKPPRK